MLWCAVAHQSSVLWTSGNDRVGSGRVDAVEEAVNLGLQMQALA